MTPTAERAPAQPSQETGVLALVCAAHCISHFYILMLAPLLPIIRAEFGVSYTEIGLALSVFNVTSALFSLPTGYLVDRSGGRAMLIGGILLGALALAGAASVSSYWGFVAMFAVLGLGNTVYHPADYSLLSRRIAPARMGQAYALHTFSGMVGSAAAPPAILLLASLYGWRGAYIAAALAGFAIAMVLLAFGRVLADGSEPQRMPAAGAPAAPAQSRRQLLLSAPILLNMLIFVFLAMMSSGVTNFSVAALAALYGTPLSVSNIGLSLYLAVNAAGVLAGGYIAMRTSRHDLVSAIFLAVFALSILPIALFDTGTALLLLLLSLAGLVNGIIAPSRDMLVRAVTPPGAFGLVFGFVTNGFNIGGMVTPLAFGWLLDHGSPRGVFIASAAFAVIAIPLVLLNGWLRRA